MNEEHAAGLYAQMEQLMAHFSYRSHQGIGIELMDFLPDIVHIKKSSFRVDENDHYQIVAEIEPFERFAAKEAFNDLLHAVGYAAAALYVRRIGKESITYLTASLMEDGIGFMMHITFIPVQSE